MKRKILQFIILLLLLFFALFACKKEPVDGISLDKTLMVSVGETATLTVTFIPANATNKKISWKSSDPNVATVENGKVIGIAVGNAKITATSHDGGRSAQCIVYVTQPIEPELVWVEGGTFTMGCTNEQGDDCLYDESPNHKVTVSSFYMGKYEVTQKEWVAAMGTNPSYPEAAYSGENKPVHLVSWTDVQGYITILNAYTGKNYRLPTEAEWEFAARGGNKSEGYKYSGSNNINDITWYYPNNNNMILNNLNPVGEKAPNEIGIFDMSGSVWEYCSDWYGNYTPESQINPTGPEKGNGRVARGGAWYNTLNFMRVSYRYSSLPDIKYTSGFRLVLPAEQKKD